MKEGFILIVLIIISFIFLKFEIFGESTKLILSTILIIYVSTYIVPKTYKWLNKINVRIYGTNHDYKRMNKIFYKNKRKLTKYALIKSLLGAFLPVLFLFIFMMFVPNSKNMFVWFLGAFIVLLGGFGWGILIVGEILKLKIKGDANVDPKIIDYLEYYSGTCRVTEHDYRKDILSLSIISLILLVIIVVYLFI